MATNKVSVIIPTFKRNQPLHNAIACLCEQTYKNIEVIVVNDCSLPEWVEIVNNITSPFIDKLDIKVIHNESSLGSAGARDVAIANCSGEYVTFLDDDDLYLPEKIESQLECMIKNAADFGVTDLEQYDENGKFVEKRTRDYIKSTDNEQLLKYHYLYHITCTNTIMFKKTYLDEIGGFKCADMGDEFFLIEKAILGGGKFCYDNSCFVRTCVHSKLSGVSSGLSKINGEKKLFEHKKANFYRFTKKEIRSIRVRYKMVIAYAYFRMRKLFKMFGYMACAAFISPKATIRFLKSR